MVVVPCEGLDARLSVCVGQRQDGVVQPPLPLGLRVLQLRLQPGHGKAGVRRQRSR